MQYKYKLKEAEVGDTKVVGGVKYTVRDVDPETGAIAWKVDYVPAFDSTFKEFQELRQFMTKLSRETKDETIDSIAKEVRELFNKYRTHLRKNYSEEYKKMTMTEEEVEETSTSGAAGAYNTKYAFKLPKKQKEIVPEAINLPSLDSINLQNTTDIKYKNYIDNNFVLLASSTGGKRKTKQRRKRIRKSKKSRKSRK